MDVSISISLNRVLTDCSTRQLCFLVKNGSGEKFGVFFFSFVFVQFFKLIFLPRCVAKRTDDLFRTFLLIVPI